MSENISDVDLERFLRRRDRISREYLALGSEGPAAVLDARVLEEARLALEQDASASLWRRRRWPMITALAATVLLSLGLILRVALESDQAVFAPPSVASESEGAKKDARAFTQSAAEQPAAQPPARTADPIPPELPRPQIEGGIRGASGLSKLAAPASAPTETHAQSREQFEDKRNDSGVRFEVGLMKEEVAGVRQNSEAAPTAVAEPAVAAPAPAPAEAEADATEGFAPSRDAAGNAARAPKESQRALKSPSTIDEAQRLPDPEAWLEQIEKLRADGQIEDANREMERFLAVYPRYLEEHPRPPAQ